MRVAVDTDDALQREADGRHCLVGSRPAVDGFGCGGFGSGRRWVRQVTVECGWKVGARGRGATTVQGGSGDPSRPRVSSNPRNGRRATWTSCDSACGYVAGDGLRLLTGSR